MDIGASQSAAIQGMRVFVVEDEMLLAMLLEDMLADLGCVMTGSAQTVAAALAQVSGPLEFEAAILDVHIGGEMVFPVADMLVERHVPFIFSSGFGPAVLTELYPDKVLLPKPYVAQALAARLAAIRNPAASIGSVPSRP